MAIIPTVRCRHMDRSIAFYTEVLDFECVEGGGEGDPSFSVLTREGAPLFLSSHRGDGMVGQAIVVSTDDVDAVFRKFRTRGLQTPGNPEAPSAVTRAPLIRAGARANSMSMIPTATPYGSRRAYGSRRFWKARTHGPLHPSSSARASLDDPKISATDCSHAPSKLNRPGGDALPEKQSTAKEHIHYHKDGTIWANGKMIDGVMTGYWELFRKDGSIMRSGYLENGEQVGQWTTYDQTGKVVKVTTMKPKKAPKSHEST